MDLAAAEFSFSEVPEDAVSEDFDELDLAAAEFSSEVREDAVSEDFEVEGFGVEDCDELVVEDVEGAIDFDVEAFVIDDFFTFNFSLVV